MKTIFIAALAGLGALASAQELLKSGATLYPPEVVARVRANVANDAWAGQVRDRIVENAAPWLAMSDDELWNLVFGATLKRSWMVWSDGYSPATGDPVPMYNWEMDALEHPWKVKCPHSGELFPKNDFKAFYDSGLDERGIFDPARADRGLLYNAEHPDPDDPLHTYGVDDGDGYVNEKGERWRFINTYLIYGQWKQLIVGGAQQLGAAYLVTGDTRYARKAGILLDRIADVYPTYDFAAQGVLYEGPGSAGYVSTWHDACEEVRELAQAYDMVFEGIRDDEALVDVLSAKAAQHGLENPKASFDDIQRNIEGRILRETLANPAKVHSNYPRREVLYALLLKVLDEPDEAFWGVVDPMFETATAVDGVTGEKGLAGYASFTIQTMAMFLAEMSKADPSFLPRVLERHPGLRETYRFHIDTYCLDGYYPLSGDTGWFAGPMPHYVGMNFLKPETHERNRASYLSWTSLPPSTYRLLWDFYEATGDPAYVQVLYRENGRSLHLLPYDMYGETPELFQKNVAEVIGEVGPELKLDSVNKQDWHLAILRSGTGNDARAVWLDYDSGGGHGHADGMNLGLFAYGLDLLPEKGYPPVQFGGWGSPKAKWYTKSAAHNTVAVDGADQPAGAGATALWYRGADVQAIRATGGAMNGGNRFERTIVLVDTPDGSFYSVDVFRVAGGTDRTKFVHSHYGDMAIAGLDLKPADDYGHGTQMRNFEMDTSPEPGWHAEWGIEDRYGLRTATAPVGMRYTDFSRVTEAGRAEGWIVAGIYSSTEEEWIPRLLVRDRGDGATTFVSVYEPFEGEAPKRTIERLDAPGSGHVALAVTLADGTRDTLVLRDVQHAAPVPEGGGEFHFAREGVDGTRHVETDATRDMTIELGNGASVTF